MQLATAVNWIVPDLTVTDDAEFKQMQESIIHHTEYISYIIRFTA